MLSSAADDASQERHKAYLLWYGDGEKKERRNNIRFIKCHFPQIQAHGISKMAHAESVIVHPKEFCRYAEKFLIGQMNTAVRRDIYDRTCQIKRYV